MAGETSVVRHEIRVDASPETVFAYFTDPARIVRWMGTAAMLDPRPGGVCRLEINGGVALGEFVQVSPPWRLVLTWGWEQELLEVPPQSTAVEVSFTPDGDGTIVRLAHCRLPRSATAFHQAGWEHYLSRLATVAAGRDPGPDAFADVETARRAIRAVAGRPS